MLMSGMSRDRCPGSPETRHRQPDQKVQVAATFFGSAVPSGGFDALAVTGSSHRRITVAIDGFLRRTDGRYAALIELPKGPDGKRHAS